MSRPAPVTSPRERPSEAWSRPASTSRTRCSRMHAPTYQASSSCTETRPRCRSRTSRSTRSSRHSCSCTSELLNERSKRPLACCDPAVGPRSACGTSRREVGGSASSSRRSRRRERIRRQRFRRVPSFFRLADDAEFASLLEGAGLTDVTVETVEFGLELADGDELWDGLVEGSVRVRPDDPRPNRGAAARGFTRASTSFSRPIARRPGSSVPVSVKLAVGTKP